MAAQGIDIGDGCKRIENEQEDSTEGHWVQDSIEQNFRNGEVLYFERTFDFHCPKMSTSFYFRVTLTVSRATAFSSVACVKRTDQGAGLVNVRLVTNVCSHGFSEVSVRHAFPGLGAGKVLRDTFQDSVLEETVFAFREEGNLSFEVVLTVECCHGEQEGVESTDTPGSDDSSPKKRLRLQSSS